MAERAKASRLLAVVAPCIIAAGCAGAGGAQPHPASASACGTSDLAVSLGGSGVAAGMWSALVTFTNQGTMACDLSGYPAVIGVMTTGETTSATEVADLMNGLNVGGVPPVTVQPGHSAGADVSGAVNGCPSRYQELRVTPPGATGALTVPAYLEALSANMPSCGGLRVSAVHDLADFSFPGH